MAKKGPSTAEEVLALIDSLPEQERKKLLSMLREGKLIREQVTLFREQLDLLENAIGSGFERYQRGPKKRKTDAEHRRQKIKEMMDSGIIDPGKIRRQLKDGFGIEVTRKTVQNDISILRKS